MLSAHTPPDPETVRQAAHEILQRPEYQLDQPTGNSEWLIDLLLDSLYWVLKPFRWLFDVMEGLPDALRWIIVIGLAVLLVALVAHIIYSLVGTLRTVDRRAAFRSAYADPFVSSAELEELAQQALAVGDYIAAIRHLFRAGLIHLQDAEGTKFRPGMTNRAHLHRYQNSSFVESLRLFVETIDASWYGNSECREEDYLKCRAAYVVIRQQTKDDSHAHSA